jgi:hypothetical protein
VMHIDNRALDGFAEHFKTHDCYHSSCEECGYCKRWAEKTVRVDEEKRKAILKRFDLFIEAIIERRTLAENTPLDVGNIHLSPEAASVLDSLMVFVPPPLAEIARMKTINGAAQITGKDKNPKTDHAVDTGAIVHAFWLGTPEPSRDPLRQALQQMGLWQHVAAAEQGKGC